MGIEYFCFAPLLFELVCASEYFDIGKAIKYLKIIIYLKTTKPKRTNFKNIYLEILINI